MLLENQLKKIKINNKTPSIEYITECMAAMKQAYNEYSRVLLSQVEMSEICSILNEAINDPNFIKSDFNWAAMSLQLAGYHKVEWISVKKQLPAKDKFDWVLVAVIFDEDGSYGVPMVAEYRNNEWWDGSDRLKDLHLTVTHWMPLPKQPEEQNIDD